VLTGFNEAFIISGDKKDEILANCKDDAERKRTDELIRPILRGRDIKRYSYDFSDRYLITTFPSLKIDINKYSSVKNFLEGFKPKLKQAGEQLTDLEKEQVLKHAKEQGINISDGDLKKSRKKSNNKWFETQDSISYWEDFYKQKIAWNRIASKKQFALIDEGMFIQDSMHFFTGNHLYYLSAILNSKLFSWLLGLIVGEAAGGNAGNSDNIRNLKIPYPSIELEKEITKHLNKKSYNEIDNIIFRLYEFNYEEINTIESE